MMEITNQQVAGMLSFMGELLELTGDNPFKVRAFYRAADTVDRLSRPVSVMTEKELDQIPGIGEKIAKKIREIVETGTFNELEELKRGVPSPLLELLKLEGIGPKTVFKLWKKMNILTIDDLEKAAKGHRIRAIKGFGAKKEEQFLRSIELFRSQTGRMTLPEAEEVVAHVLSVLAPGTFEVAGSYRRGKSTVGDIDIVSTEPPSLLNPRLHNVAEEVIDEGDRRTSIRVLGKRVDIRFARPAQFGS
ncbi:MAG: helix-hairpin-helix domain-containing protein, partial [Methanoregulaceae archaeon]|nr:helix-hairpin-helix domain-containing protein [Methanoregulaceae archaeon]